MKRLRLSHAMYALTFAVALPLAACSQIDDFEDPDAIQSALSQPNGGMDMEDEAPMFGSEDLFADAEIVDEEDIDDPMEGHTDIAEMERVPGATRYVAAIRWGQIPFNPDAEGVRDWSGDLSLNRGAIRLRKSVGFERPSGDRATRTDIRTIRIDSRTSIASDGLRLEIIDPTPNADEPLRLNFQDGNGSVYSVDVADLEAAPQREDIDNSGNRVVAVALRRGADACDAGFIRGRWHKVADHGGRLLGRVRSADGDLLGHMQGIYGQRRNGNKVFFGKYINTDGEFRGLFAGRYDAGHMRGLWLTRGGEFGALGGHYRESLPGRRVGGHYLGRWAETSCQVSTDSDRDLPTRPDGE